MIKLATRLLVPLALAMTATASSAVRAQDTEISIELGGIGFDMELDEVRQLLYVTVPTLNEVVFISTESYVIVDRVVVGSQPHGIDLSSDGTRLFVALNQAGSIIILDPDTKSMTEVVVGGMLGTSLAYDVVEGKENRVFVSGNPGSSGFAYIVMIKLDEDNALSRVADNRIIRCNPVFEDSSDNRFLYVGECFSPNSLYKLDVQLDTAPIVLEDDHGSVSGTSHLEVNPDGSRIYLTTGQVLRTGSFIQAGLVGAGVHQFGDDAGVVHVAVEPSTIELYDTTTFLLVDEVALPCAFVDIKRLVVLPGSGGWLVLGDDLVCGLASPAIPKLACVGFDAPLDMGPASVASRGTLAVQAELQDAGGAPITSSDILAKPVAQIQFESGMPDAPPFDVTAYLFPFKLKFIGNQFFYVPSVAKWLHGFLTPKYLALGTYAITMTSGNTDEYVIDPTCVATFVVE